MLNNQYRPMHAPPAQQPTPFLQKFHGKQQKINRDGILQLIHENKQPQKDVASPQPQNKSRVGSLREAISVELGSRTPMKLQLPQKPSSKPQKNIFSSQQLKGSQSERALDNMAFHLSKRGELKPFAAEELKLPPISRSNSQNTKILSKQVFNPNVEMLESDRSHRKKESSGSFYSKHSDRVGRQMELDEFVLRHMEFLHKFEKQLISNRLSQGAKFPKQ